MFWVVAPIIATSAKIICLLVYKDGNKLCLKGHSTHFLLNFLFWRAKQRHCYARTPEGECTLVSDVPPTSMVQMEKIFSASVLAQTLPKPTLVRLLRVK